MKGLEEFRGRGLRGVWDRENRGARALGGHDGYMHIPMDVLKFVGWTEGMIDGNSPVF